MQINLSLQDRSQTNLFYRDVIRKKGCYFLQICLLFNAWPCTRPSTSARLLLVTTCPGYFYCLFCVIGPVKLARINGVKCVHFLLLSFSLPHDVLPLNQTVFILPFAVMLSPGQTIAACQRNIVGPNMLRSTQCCDMLRWHVAIFWPGLYERHQLAS